MSIRASLRLKPLDCHVASLSNHTLQSLFSVILPWLRVRSITVLCYTALIEGEVHTLKPLGHHVASLSNHTLQSLISVILPWLKPLSRHVASLSNHTLQSLISVIVPWLRVRHIHWSHWATMLPVSWATHCNTNKHWDHHDMCVLIV